MPVRPGQEEPLERIKKIVNAFLTRDDSGPFREPVDWRALELHDYPEIITNMMDLGTVQRKLEREQYETAHLAAEDIRLVWNNCMTYNSEGSDFWALAKTFARRFEDRYRKVVRDFDVGDGMDEDTEDEDKEEDDDEDEEMEFEGDGPSKKEKDKAPSPTAAPVPVEEVNGDEPDIRQQFAKNLPKLNGVELGYIVRLIENDCPEAIEIGQALPGKMELKLEHISDDLMNTLNDYAADIAKQRPKSKRKILPINDISNKRNRKR